MFVWVSAYVRVCVCVCVSVSVCGSVWRVYMGFKGGGGRGAFVLEVPEMCTYRDLRSILWNRTRLTFANGDELGSEPPAFLCPHGACLVWVWVWVCCLCVFVCVCARARGRAWV